MMLLALPGLLLLLSRSAWKAAVVYCSGLIELGSGAVAVVFVAGVPGASPGVGAVAAACGAPKKGTGWLPSAVTPSYGEINVAETMGIGSVSWWQKCGG